MAFERDFVERFKEDGRNVLINYHKGLKQAHLNMVPAVNGLLQSLTPKPGDQRFTQHFVTQSQREEQNVMHLIGPPDRADYEMVNLAPEVAAQLYGVYAAFNHARCEQIRPTAPPEVIQHLERVTQLLRDLAQAAAAGQGRVTVPVGLMNLAYDSVLAEADPASYERAMVAAPAARH
jgi:hypothetical protein